MGKSSSSIKKKRLKSSSQGRASKRSKTRRGKLKKLRSRNDSVSYSDDESRRSISVSSSSSEDSHKNRRSRSYSRKEVKGSKRKARARSSSCEGPARVRKQRGSKRNDDYAVRKKLHEKKKSRRDASVSSTSRGSWSCSTCQSPSTSSDESEYGRHRGRSKRRESRKKNSNIRNGTKKRRHRSRSCSSCSRHVESSHYWSEKVTGENASKRLRSIVTLPNKDQEQGDLDNDKHKEEMIYDHDDYPCKSNDSNDVGNKRELAYQSHVSSEKKRPIGDEEIEDASFSKPKAATESVLDGESPYARGISGCDSPGTNNAVEKNEMSGAIGNVNGDLESILRQKALENLRRFRGEFQTNARTPVNQGDKNDSTAKTSSTANTELGQIKPLKDDPAIVVQNDSVHFLQNDEKIPMEENCGNKYGYNNDTRALDLVANTSRETVSATVGSGINKPSLVNSAQRQPISNAATTRTEAPSSPYSNRSVAQSASKSVPQPADTLTSSNSSVNGEKINNPSASTLAEPLSHHTSAAGDFSSNKLHDEGKEGPQLEQKTMSVMRGGEMVQVSYKVYIPKKAPALARRQLKR